jgi:hypothetical protein
MKYTTFNVPLGCVVCRPVIRHNIYPRSHSLNPKHTGGSYLKNEMNNHWARQSRRQGKVAVDVRETACALFSVLMLIP